MVENTTVKDGYSKKGIISRRKMLLFVIVVGLVPMLESTLTGITDR